MDNLKYYNLKIKIHKPKSKILQNYIECFYTLQRNDNDENVTYFGFPSNTVFVTLCQDAEVSINENDLTIENSSNGKIKSILIIDNQKQGATTYRGKTNEISIYFKPLGINAFLEKPFSCYSSETISEFYPFEDYEKAMNAVFKIKEDTQKMEFIENYFLTKIKEFKHPFLHQAIALMINTQNQKLTITEIAIKNAVSRTTFNKQFLLHIGTTPSQFIKIERFRNALKMFTTNATKEQLIDIVYLADYFDQSHMAKDFKSLTGYSPKLFFSKITKIENSQINWIFS